jgi:hypothetical protein
MSVDFAPGQSAKDQLYVNLLGGAALYGILPGDGGTSLVDILRAAPNVDDVPTEVIGGQTTYRIDTQGPWGRHSVWLDPQSGFLPRRIQVLKRGSDRVNDRSVTAMKASGVEGGLYPNRDIKEISQNIDSIKIENSEGHHAITGFTSTVRYLYVDDSTLELRSVLSVDEIDFNPAVSSETFQVSLSIPNGTPVIAVGSPQIQLEWYHGEIQTKFDKRIVHNLTDLNPVSQPESPGSFVVFAISASVLLIGVVAFIYWYRSSRR